MTTDCFKKSLETSTKIGLKNKLGADNNPFLDQIITPERAKLGPDRCPTYQLHLPRKRDLGSPETLSREMPENSGEIQGFLLNNIEMPRKRPIQRIPEVHSGDPERAFWDDFLGRMRTAKVDMLGAVEKKKYIYIYIYIYICRRVRLQGFIFGTPDFQAFFGKGFFLLLWGAGRVLQHSCARKVHFFPTCMCANSPGEFAHLASEATGSAEPVG